MGDWSFEPYGTDESADWFARFWRSKDVTLVIEEIDHFDPRQERFEQLRAAAYVLAAFGDPFMWPSAHADELVRLLQRAVSLLTTMIAPEDPWGFFDAWGGEQVRPAVAAQIAALQARLPAAVR